VRKRVAVRAKEGLRTVLHRFGIDVQRHGVMVGRYTLLGVRRRLLQELGIDLVLDVGGNQGQYAHQLRASGYRGRIVSFEPLREAFSAMSVRAAADPLWDVRQVALGDEDRTLTLNVAANSFSSSLLPMLDRHLEAAPHSHYVGIQECLVVRLDSVAEELLGGAERVLLKLDVQGYEMSVVRGATANLSRVAVVESELSLVPLYVGQALLPDVVNFLQEQGFELVFLERAFVDRRTGYILQMDGLFLSGALGNANR
jgi:FkbM family methyltransferase